MKSCKGCKHLVAFWCHCDRNSSYIQDPYTEEWGRVPDSNLLTAEEERTRGACGMDRANFEGNWRYRFKNWIMRSNDNGK